MAKQMELPAAFAAAGKDGRGASDSDGLIYKTFGITTKAGSLNEKERSIEVVASTDAIDSYDEIVEQDWDLSRFRQNAEKTGPVLYNHNRASGGLFGGGLRQEETLPIGKAANAEVVDGQLQAKLIFATAAANPFAELVWNQFREGMISAVSVGFRSGEHRREKRGNRDVTVLSKNTLYEISATPIGANPEAHAKNQQPELDSRAFAEDKDMDPEARIKELEQELSTVKASLEAANKAAQDAVTTHKTEIDKRDGEITALKTALVEKTGDLTKITGERDSAVKDRDEARKSLATVEVKALVGKKITPDEVEDYVVDYLADKAKFDKRIAKRPDLHLGDEVSRGAGGDLTTNKSADTADQRLADAISVE